jgi:hypothetical protein
MVGPSRPWQVGVHRDAHGWWGAAASAGPVHRGAHEGWGPAALAGPVHRGAHEGWGPAASAGPVHRVVHEGRGAAWPGCALKRRDLAAGMRLRMRRARQGVGILTPRPDGA